MGLAPPASANWVAYEPSPPLAPPDEHVVALLHLGAVAGDELPVGGGVDQAGAAASSQLRWPGLGISWLDLTSAISARPPKLVSKPQMRCSGRASCRCGRRRTPAHREAVGDDLVARPPGVDAGAGAQDHAGEVGADDVVRQVVAPGELGELAVALEEPEGRQRLEDRGPHRVVVDRGCHDGHEGLARTEFGQWHVVDVQGLAGVLVAGGETGEYLRLVLVHGDRAVRLGERKSGEIGGRCRPRLNRVQDVLHGVASGEWRLEGRR